MPNLDQRLNAALQELHEAHTYKRLRNIAAPMDTTTRIDGVGEVLVFCSNNYLGLANR
jgi:7-keto-8-aminopelargonate synthetase-like enzyme